MQHVFIKILIRNGVNSAKITPILKNLEHLQLGDSDISNLEEFVTKIVANASVQKPNTSNVTIRRREAQLQD